MARNYKRKTIGEPAVSRIEEDVAVLLDEGTYVFCNNRQRLGLNQAFCFYERKVENEP